MYCCDCFARRPDLPGQVFRSYLADFPCLREAEATSFEGLVTEREVRDTLKQVDCNKSPGLDGLPNEVYLRLLHMFVPIPMEPSLVALAGALSHC